MIWDAMVAPAARRCLPRPKATGPVPLRAAASALARLLSWARPGSVVPNEPLVGIAENPAISKLEGLILHREALRTMSSL